MDELSEFQKLTISDIYEAMKKQPPPKSVAIQGRRSGKTDTFILLSKIMRDMFNEENKNLKIWFNVSDVIKSKCIIHEFVEFITKIKTPF